MFSLSRRLWQDDHGFLVSSELVLIATVGVLGLLAGLTCVRDAVVCELKDVAGSIGSLNQSYCVSGFRSFKGNCGVKAWTAGSSFFDCEDGVVAAPAFDCVPHVYEAVPNLPPPCVDQPLPPVLPAPPQCPPAMLAPPELPPCVDVSPCPPTALCPPVGPAISPCPCPAAPGECCPAAPLPCDGVLAPACPVPGHPCFPPQPLVW